MGTAAGSPRRGGGTRKRLVAAAVRAFGERGFGAAGTRELVGASGGRTGCAKRQRTRSPPWRAAFAPLLERMKAS